MGEMKPLLEEVLGRFREGPHDGVTLADLGSEAPGQASLDVMASDYYTHRAGVSWGLCSPGYATGYVGEYFSGFTVHLVLDLLVRESAPMSALISQGYAATILETGGSWIQGAVHLAQKNASEVGL